MKSKPKTRKRKAKAASGRKETPKKTAPRADFGDPIDGFFEKQHPRLRAIFEELRRMVKGAG